MRSNRIKAQWCGRYSNTLRGGFIATASEGSMEELRGLLQTLPRLVDAASQAHGTRAYQECCEEATKLKNDELLLS